MASKLTPTNLQINKDVRFVLMVQDTIVERFVLPINPEELTDDSVHRIEVSKTKAGAFVDWWGTGLGTVSLRGQTGYRRSEKNNLDGAESIKALKKICYTDYHMEIDKAETPDDVQLILINNIDQWVYQVVPIDRFRVLRNKSKPMVFQYEVQLQVIEDLMVTMSPALSEDVSIGYLKEDSKLRTQGKKEAKDLNTVTKGTLKDLNTRPDMARDCVETEGTARFILAASKQYY